MDFGVDAAYFEQNVPAGTWAPTALPVPFVLAPPPSGVVTSADAAAELEVALRTWSRPACTSFRARYDGQRATAPADDGLNAVFIHEAVWPAELEPGAVAQTIVTLGPDGTIHDADIHLNAVEHRFSLDGAPGTQDLRSVLVHELGHALGLGHSKDPRATMAASGSGLRWRSLEADDRDGVCTLYPGANGGSPACDALPCPAGLVCVAGGCQRPGARADVCSPCERVAGACEAAGDDARCIDIGQGPTAGRVCGRACARDDECGVGFACRPTTEAGDRQCVSLDGCRTAASPCASDADCNVSVCRAGACVGAVAASEIDAGVADSGVEDAGSDASFEAGGGGCGCRVTRTRVEAPGALVVLALFACAALQARRRSRRSAPQETSARRNAAAPEEPVEPGDCAHPSSLAASSDDGSGSAVPL